MATENPPHKLLVVDIAVEAIKLPVTHMRELMRFGCIPFAISLVANLLIRAGKSMPSGSTQEDFRTAIFVLVFLVFICGGIAAVPFGVAWIRLVLSGARSVSRRPVWIFGGVEGRLLLVKCLLAAVTLLPAIVCGASLAFAFERGGFPAVVAALLVFATLVLSIGVTIRLSFALIQVALQRFAGLRASWRQTRGCVWRLIAIAVLCGLPYIVAGILLGVALVSLHGGFLSHFLVDAISAMAGLGTTMAEWSGMALAYQFTALESQPDDAAATT